jgi:RimJ/RimL family protein N-acetyltransferase
VNTTIPTKWTSRLVLRPFTEDDAEPLYGILCQDDILRYFPNPGPPSPERVQRLVAHQLVHWAERGLGWWAVQPRGTQELIGWCGLQFLPETQETEVGYLLSRPFWGRGLTTEAATTSLRFGFEELGLESIIGLVHPDNIASRRVLEKLGMGFVDRAIYFGMECLRYSLASSAFDPNRRPRPEARQDG